MGKRAGYLAMQSDGVFSYLTAEIAFIDRVDLSFWGTRRLRPLKGMVSIDRNFPIAGPKSLYARCVDGCCLVSGNPFQQKYGVIRWPRRVPEGRLMLRSQQTPLSCAKTELVSDSLMRRGFKCRVTLAELTFDLTETSVDFFERHVLTRAQRWKRFKDELGWKTLYVGGFRSPWQLRIYDKRNDVVRVEFIFRRAFLQNHGISRPHELALLRTIDLRRLARVRKIDQSKLPLVDEWTDYRARLVRSWADRFSTQEFFGALKASEIVRPDLFIPCDIETKLRRLQRRLVW